MSKVTEAFSNGKAFIPFLTAGDPNIEKTENYILELEKAGADLIEIGIPFSDPIAEGVVIQDIPTYKAQHMSMSVIVSLFINAETKFVHKYSPISF